MIEGTLVFPMSLRYSLGTLLKILKFFKKEICLPSSLPFTNTDKNNII